MSETAPPVHVPTPVGELATWKSHKLVKAGQILEIRELETPAGAPILDQHDAFEIDLVPAWAVENQRIDTPARIRVSKNWANRHRPQPRGFIVIYEDGYISYSPGEAFLGGYCIRPSSVIRRIDSHVVNPANDLLKIGVMDQLGAGGAPHHYRIVGFKGRGGEVDLVFQNGPIDGVGVNGITHEVLLAIVIDRLQMFQKGPYACRENAIALTKLEEAAMWLHKRTRDRMLRGVEGTMSK